MKLNNLCKIAAAAAITLTGLFIPRLKAAEPARLTVAAASDLQYALADLVKEFNVKNPATQVSVSYGSSGKFFAQLQNGAPFDLYLSADIQYPKKLEAAGLTLDPIFPYAVGRLVLWVPNSNPVDVKSLGIKALLEPSIHKIAIANPQHAPYGRAAVAALKSLQVYPKIESKLVYGENITQTAQFVQSGAADAGLIALSLAVAPKMSNAGRYWDIPASAYPKMEQGGVILKSTHQLPAARAFRDFLFSPHGMEVLKKFGFSIPAK